MAWLFASPFGTNGDLMEKLTLTFGQIEAVLAQMNEIADDKRVAFRSRLKNVSNVALKAAERPGRGKAATYSVPHLMAFTLAIEMVQSGLSPSLSERLIRAYNAEWMRGVARECFEQQHGLRDELNAGADGWKPGAIADDILVLARLEALSDLTAAAGEEAKRPIMGVVRRDEMSTAAEMFGRVGLPNARWRVVAINLGQLTRAVLSTLCAHFQYAEMKAAQDDIIASAFAYRHFYQPFWGTKLVDPIDSPDSAAPQLDLYDAFLPSIRDVTFPLFLLDRQEMKAVVSRILDDQPAVVADFLDCFSKDVKGIDNNKMQMYCDTGLMIIANKILYMTFWGRIILQMNANREAEVDDVSPEA